MSSDYIYEIGRVAHQHDRYGLHLVHARPAGIDNRIILSGSLGPIDPIARINLTQLSVGDTVHCQGGGDHFLGIVHMEGAHVPFPPFCACGTHYRSDQYKAWCSNYRCGVTEKGRLRYFVSSYFRNKIQRAGLSDIVNALHVSGITSISDLFIPRNYEPSMREDMAYSVCTSLNTVRFMIRNSRDIQSVDQNSFIFSLLDSLGVPELTFPDIHAIVSNETIGIQNRDVPDSGAYYYNALLQPDYLAYITGMEDARATRISSHCYARDFSGIFGGLSRTNLEEFTDDDTDPVNDNDLFGV